MATFILNSAEYAIDEFHGGWGWHNFTHREESNGCFATAVEAQQDAINWEAGRDRREEEAEEEERELAELRKEEHDEHAYLNWKRR